MKLKNKILLTLICTIGILFMWNLTADAKTYDKTTFSIDIPSTYQIVENSSNMLEAQRDNGTTVFQLEVEEGISGAVITEEYMDYIIESLKNSLGTGFSLISKDIITKNGCVGLEVEFLQDYTGLRMYFSVYQFMSDNYVYSITLGTTNRSYLNSTEKKQIINSFKIKDTVVASNGIPFTDVSKNSWYYNTVKYVYEANIITGANKYEFKPESNITRGMIVTILWRMEGQPKVTGVKDFPDVTKQYYYDAVRWATKNKVVNGYNNGKFGPNDNITREQLAVILSNYAKYKGKNVTATVNTNKFKDWNKTTGYARPAMQWAIAKGVITGKDNGTRVDPQGTATRAEAAGMIYNYCMKVK